MTTFPDPAHPLDAVVASDEERSRFVIEDDAAAAWAMRKLRAAHHKAREADQIAADEIARVNRWLEDVRRPLNRDADFFTALLTDYALRCRQNDQDGRKTISLPAGTVSTRTTQNKVIVNADEFLPWARQNHPELIKIVETPDTTAVKAIINGRPIATTEDGEVIPGVTIQPAGISVTATPDLN